MLSDEASLLIYMVKLKAEISPITYLPQLIELL